MPYIKQDFRPFYNEEIEKLIMDGKADRSLDTSVKISDAKLKWVKDEIVKNVLRKDLKSQDGDLNYFITKLMKRLRWCIPRVSFFGSVGSPVYTQLKGLIIDILEDVYSPPNYFNYNRAIGMLACCRQEFHRRYKQTSTVPMMFLEDVEDTFYNTVVGLYEDEKIIENGDVE